MDTAQRCVIALLKSSATGYGEELSEKTELEPLFPLFKQHHITPMVYNGALLCGYPNDGPAMQQMFHVCCRLYQISMRQEEELKRVFRTFEEAEIDYMPLKGAILRDYYPRPELRLMSDADVLIRLEQYDKIQKVLTDLGFTFVEESEHELIWRSKHILLELHKQLMPDKNTSFIAYFGNGWNLARKQSGHRYAMSSEDTFLFLLTHFAKHYQDGGVGCRYVVDLWLYMQKHPDMDSAYLQQELDKLNLTVFVKNLMDLMSVWFEGKPDNELTDLMTQYIFDSGSWGTGASRLTAQVMRKKRNDKVGVNSKLVYLFGVMFPSRNLLQNKYSILRKAPWMLPVIWLIRPFYKLFFERSSAVHKINEVNKVSDDGVAQQRIMLEYVGLDFDI